MLNCACVCVIEPRVRACCFQLPKIVKTYFAKVPKFCHLFSLELNGNSKPNIIYFYFFFQNFKNKIKKVEMEWLPNIDLILFFVVSLFNLLVLYFAKLFYFVIRFSIKYLEKIISRLFIFLSGGWAWDLCNLGV